jgi:hypothetical protein
LIGSTSQNKIHSVLHEKSETDLEAQKIHGPNAAFEPKSATIECFFDGTTAMNSS